MHGGAIASLIDTAVAFAIVGASEPGRPLHDGRDEGQLSFGDREGRVTAEARLIRDGRRIIVAEWTSSTTKAARRQGC